MPIDNNKLKLLYIARFLYENSDEEHPVTLTDISDMLENHSVSASRKTLYSDIDLLTEFGMDIIKVRSKHNGYYLASRTFELPELKLLVDSIQSSKFITQKKTLQLITKLESLASVHQAKLLNRQVYVKNRVKSMNESVYYNVDNISNAITRDKKITFRYYEYATEKAKKFRRDGKQYQVSPFALLCDSENYYMLAYDTEAARIKHYRVDKMTEISESEQHRDGKDVFSTLDMSSYAKHMFSMFSGTEERVRIRFANHLAGAVIDRFGSDIMLIPDDEEHFTVVLDVSVSRQFFGWLFNFGLEAEVLYPEHVRNEMRERLTEVSAMYGLE